MASFPISEEGQARAAANEWFDLTARGDIAGAWAMLSARVRDKVDVTALARALADAEAGNGKLVSRSFVRAEVHERAAEDAGVRAVAHVVDLTFEAHYVKLADAVEVVRVVQEPDGAFRIDGDQPEPAPCRPSFPGPSSLPAPPPGLALDPFYAKYLLADGIPLTSSAQVSDHALQSASVIVRRMLRKRPDIRDRLIAEGVRVTVMSPTEQTLDVPEERYLAGRPTDTPDVDWNARARGLGGSFGDPLVSCGEENLLCSSCDRYAGSNVLIHEFGHAIEGLGLGHDVAFQRELVAAYDAAMAKGIWRDKYPSTNKHEYWAVGVQSWFDANVAHERHSRKELTSFDPALYALLSRVFVDDDWRFTCGDTGDVPPLPDAVAPKIPAVRPLPRTCPAGMVPLAGGAFPLGADAVVQPFCMDVTEVTVADYASCVRSHNCTAAPTTVHIPSVSEQTQAEWSTACNGARADRMQHPINCVDWNQATAFCHARGKRLPTEQEWQWAARAGVRAWTWPWGMTAPVDQLCWSGRAGRDGTCEVGHFPQGDTPEGIHDLAGNVWELTSSVLGGTARVEKGGAWDTEDATNTRATALDESEPAVRTHQMGFRCAK